MADTITFAEAARLYMEEKGRTRRANTVEGYRSALNRHVLPRFGALDVSEIDADDVQEWVRSFDLPGAAEDGTVYAKTMGGTVEGIMFSVSWPVA